jgi:hypothetical protein
MHIKSIFICLFIFINSYSIGQPRTKLKVGSSPSGSIYSQINKSGKTVIPNRQFITPFGKSIEVAPYPFGLTLSADGKIAFTANSGTSPISISIIKT